MKKKSPSTCPRIGFFKLIFAGLCLVPNAWADFTVYYQQGAPVRVNGRQIPLIYVDGHDAELREADPDINFDGGTAGADGAEGPDSLALVAKDTPPIIEGASGYVLKFEEIFSGKYVPIPSGERIVSAFLLLEFIEPGSALEMKELTTDWKGDTVTWDNLGSPGDGVSEGDATHLRDVEIYQKKLVIDVTDEVMAWASGDENQGWAFSTTGMGPSILKTNHHVDVEDVNDGFSLWISTGVWGVRDEMGVFRQTDPLLINSGAFGRPALVIDFEPLPGRGPGYGVGAVAGPPPGGAPGGGSPPPGPPPGGPGPGGGGPGGGGPGGGGAPGGGQGHIVKDEDGERWLIWYDWPDTRQTSEHSEDLKEWDEDEEVVEFGPGCFARKLPKPEGGSKYFRTKHVDSDEDGAAERKGGVSRTAGETCPENVLADLFRIVEQTGRNLAEKDDEFNRTEHVSNIRTLELIYRFLEKYANGQYAVPFDRSVRGFLTGKKSLKPLRADGSPSPYISNHREAHEILKDTISYLSHLIWWKLVYDGDGYNDDQKQEIRVFRNDLAALHQQLCQLDPNAEDFAQRLKQLQDQLCQLFRGKIKQTGSPVGEVLNILYGEIAQRGIWGLFKIMLSDNFGKSFIDGTLETTKEVAETILEAIYAVATFSAQNDLIMARCKYNEALCKLVDAASEMPKFNIQENIVLTYDLLHADHVHAKLHSTSLEPLLVCYDPNAGGTGKGEWVASPLKMADDALGNGLDKNVTIKQFPAGNSVKEGKGTWVDSAFIRIPPIEEGQKCYVVLVVKRIFKDKDGNPGRVERQNYFVGVVKNTG